MYIHPSTDTGWLCLQAKDVGHIWELGGGTWLSKLIDIPVDPETIK